MTNQADTGGTPPPPGRPSPGRRPPGGPLTPHDSVFRRILGMPENMASQLRAVLPPKVAARLDLARLARVPGSFVDEALKWRHSDLLFTAPLEGRDALVYVLVEHQSSSDPLMALRMLRYVTRIWDRYLEDHPQARQLPPVIPLVVHQGPGRWNGPQQLLDLIDLDHAAKKDAEAYLPRFGYLLDDLARVDSHALLDRELTPQALVTLLLLKTAPGNPRLPADLRPWAGQLRAALDSPGGSEAFIALLTYIELVSETPASELHDLAASLGPDAEEAYMTTAEMLRTEGRTEGLAEGLAEGRTEGLAEGRTEGRTEGRNEGLAEALLQVLTVKFGTLPEDVPGKVRAASSGQVQEWTARAVTAEKIDEVFR